MIDERSVRRERFRDGPSARLGDGQEWVFPGPSGGQGIADDVPSGPEYETLLAAICEAENGVDLLRCELALAVFLLDWNYRLTPADFGEILGVPSGSTASRAMQQSFHEAARLHAEARRLRGSAPLAERPGVPPPSGALRRQQARSARTL